MRYFLTIVLSLVGCSSAHAEHFAHFTRKGTTKENEIACKKGVDVAGMNNILYKNSNVHGG